MFRKCWQVCIFVAVVMLWASLALASSLKVALYPYVPRIEQFKSCISENWKAVDPNVEITWVEKEKWDGGYENDPKDDYDLFVFDATYFTYFKNKGWLMGLNQSQIDNFNDFLPFAINGMLKDNKYWAIPQLGCTEYLIYKKDDKPLLKASSMSEIVAALGKCTYHGDIPPKATGLMMDFSGGTTNAIYYVKSLEEITDTFPVPLPQDQSHINIDAINNLRTILATASLRNAWCSSKSYCQRGLWYGQNHGRAYVDFSESLTQIPAEQLPNIAMKVMPWSDNAEGVKDPLFYCDVIGINPKTSERGTTAIAIKLANLMASTQVIVDCFKSTDSEGPQYLTPVRNSAMNQLASIYPTYATIQTAVKTSGNPILLNLGNDARAWIDKIKDTIKHMVIDDLQCYCDKQAGPPMDNQKAQIVCPSVCGDGNWNGQWTNKGDYSVCGCFCGAH